MHGIIASRETKDAPRSRRFSRIAAGAILVAAGTASVAAPRTARDELAAFPTALPGLVRRVVFLPPRPNEDALKVGVIVGQTMMVDCNRRVFGSRMETRTVQGWGYDYFVVTAVGPPASTMMACPPGSRSRRFVRSADEPLLRYNSRLPLVIFAPAQVEVRYRIWQAGPEAVAR